MSNLTLVGYERISGVSKKTGNAYDLVKLTCLEPYNSQNSRGTRAVEFMLNTPTNGLKDYEALKLPSKINPNFSFTSGQPRFESFDLVKE
jgi:hypothetical protein